jgi:hypothetical protein
MRLQIKPCPICDQVMTIKRWLAISDKDKSPFYSIYCRECSYGLKPAFNSRPMQSTLGTKRH